MALNNYMIHRVFANKRVDVPLVLVIYKKIAKNNLTGDSDNVYIIRSMRGGSINLGISFNGISLFHFNIPFSILMSDVI